MGGYPYGRCHRPRVAPRGQAGTVPAGGASVGATPLQVGRGYYPCDLVTDKRRPLWAGHGKVLPLQVGMGERRPLQAGRGQAPPL
ncbi:hypothetical protein GW17_00060724 [Ensete ventricosum]|nr:hypothetical protein GW17_00060724 [Ensete ventricosum]